MGKKRCFVGFYVLVYSCNGVRRHLNPTEVSMAVQMHLDGHSQREVARIAGVSQGVVARMWRRYQEKGQFTRRPGKDRSRCTTDADDRYIKLALRNQRGTEHYTVPNRDPGGHGTASIYLNHPQ